MPSPFTGALVWRALAAQVPGAVALDYGGVSGPDWYDGVARRIAAQIDAEPWVAVLHSGAGGFAPALVAACRNLTGLIFVDAVLPYPGRSNLATAPPDLAAALRRLIRDDGRMAPWNAWFDEGFLERLVPDAAAREAFARDLPCTPFAFLEAVAPNDDAWERLPTGYLQLSRAYATTADRAEARGWTVRRARRHHLAMVSDAADVAALLAGLP